MSDFRSTIKYDEELIANAIPESEFLTPEQERFYFEELRDAERMVIGSTWCVIDAKWFKMWKQYVQLDVPEDSIVPTGAIGSSGGAISGELSSSGGHQLQMALLSSSGGGGGGLTIGGVTKRSRPPAINNEGLLDMTATTDEKPLKMGIMEHFDYETIPLRAWLKLYAWYGGGPIIKRNVVGGVGFFASEMQVELYPVTLVASLKGGQGVLKTFEFAPATKLVNVIHTIARELNNAPHKLKLHLVEGDSTTELRKELFNTSIADLGLLTHQRILVEKETQINEAMISASYGSRMATPSYTRLDNRAGKPIQRGVTGLRNLGNTCFMNSALQCLCASTTLVPYFLTDQYKEHLNVTNPHGAKGKLANAFAELMKEMWSNKFVTIVPRKLKSVVSECAPQFSGYRQHDCQEFLAFLLDKLHEEVNVAAVTGEQAQRAAATPDPTKSWEDYLSRNKSFLVSQFQGQLKSTIKCPSCENTSVTYDPFMYLSLPVPSKLTRLLEVYVFRIHSLPMKYGVRVPKAGTIQQLKEALAELVGVPPAALVISEFYNGRSFETPDGRSIRDISSADVLHAHEIIVQSGEAEIVRAMVLNRKLALNSATSWHVFGVPFMISFEETASNNHVLEIIRERLTLLIGRADLEYSIKIVENIGSDTGRQIEPNDDAFFFSETESISVDWSQKDWFQVIDAEQAVGTHESSLPCADDAELVVPIEQCLEQFSMVEQLSERDAWFCGRCQAPKCATKQLELCQAPDVLTIHLKRFWYDAQYRDKIDTMVFFPIEGLSLGTHLRDSDAQYELYAVVNHIGVMSGGHYTAFIKSREDQRWYLMNDEHCRVVNGEDEVVTRDAYLLFYRKRGSDDGIVFPPAPEPTEPEPAGSSDNGKQNELPHSEGSSASAGTRVADMFLPQMYAEYNLPRPSMDLDSGWRPGGIGAGRKRPLHDLDEPMIGNRSVDEMNLYNRELDPYEPIMGPRPLANSAYICPLCTREYSLYDDLQVHMLVDHESELA